MIIKTTLKAEYPLLLRQISRLPESMEMIGTWPDDRAKYLCVIGARRHSQYGKNACEALIHDLKGYNIVIVSGLALGIDSIAHKAALDVGLLTIAFPGSGLAREVIYPPSHYSLAKRIVDAGGALVSPFERFQEGADWTFPTRNRLMAGLSHATLIIEAKSGSGTLITAEYATEFDRDILAVPGSILSELSYGPHMLIRRGAVPVTSSLDILEALGIDTMLSLRKHGSLPTDTQASLPLATISLSEDEKKVLNAMNSVISKETLVNHLDLPVSKISTILISLEMRGIIRELEGVLYRS